MCTSAMAVMPFEQPRWVVLAVLPNKSLRGRTYWPHGVRSSNADTIHSVHSWPASFADGNDYVIRLLVGATGMERTAASAPVT